MNYMEPVMTKQQQLLGLINDDNILNFAGSQQRLNCVSQVEQLLQGEMAEYKLDQLENTALMLYCRAANIEGIQMMIAQKGAVISQQNKEQRSALHIICSHDSQSYMMLDIVLQNRQVSDIGLDLTTLAGLTPLMLAA